MDIPEQSSNNGIADGLKTVSYVADTKGKQQLVPGSIWQPVNIVNRQAWQEIERHIEAAKEKVASGRASCLHYYMTANQMDIGLLAQYTRQARWRVHLHLFPFFFNRLALTTINRYAEVFQVSSDDLIRGVLRSPVYDHGVYEEQSVD